MKRPTPRSSNIAHRLEQFRDPLAWHTHPEVNPHTNPVCIRSRLELLRKSPLFEKLTDEELAALSAHAHLISFKAGQPVWRAGAPVDTLYKLVAGKLELTSAVRQVRRRRTANLWQGKCRIFAT